MKNTIACSIALTLALCTTAWAQKSEKGEVMELPKTSEKEKTPVPPKSDGSKPPVSPRKDDGKDDGKSVPAPAAQAVTCTLLTKEAPRGGRLEVRGDKLGKSPVVKIGGAVTRIIERPGDKIAVQIPKTSDGGAVVVLVDGKDIACGSLTIIGLD